MTGGVLMIEFAKRFYGFGKSVFGYNGFVANAQPIVIDGLGGAV